jgi:anti-anti-sigma factor
MTDVQVVRQEGTKAVVEPAGDMVALTASELRPVLRQLVQEGVRDLVVDLCRVTMMDSSGLGLLIATHNSLRKVGGVLAVVHASDDVLELFRSMRIQQHFSVNGAPRS